MSLYIDRSGHIRSFTIKPAIRVIEEYGAHASTIGVQLLACRNLIPNSILSSSCTNASHPLLGIVRLQGSFYIAGVGEERAIEVRQHEDMPIKVGFLLECSRVLVQLQILEFWGSCQVNQVGGVSLSWSKGDLSSLEDVWLVCFVKISFKGFYEVWVCGSSV